MNNTRMLDHPFSRVPGGIHSPAPVQKAMKTSAEKALENLVRFLLSFPAFQMFLVVSLQLSLIVSVGQIG